MIIDSEANRFRAVGGSLEGGSPKDRWLMSECGRAMWMKMEGPFFFFFFSGGWFVVVDVVMARFGRGRLD